MRNVPAFSALIPCAWRPARSHVFAAVVSGVLLGWAFPPVAAKPFIWFGLVPLLMAIAGCANARQAAVLGWISGAVFFFLVLHPLVSVHSWVGWVRENAFQKAVRMNRQWYFMHFLWLLFCAWCGVFWGAWAALLKRHGRTPATWLLVAVCAWLLIPERARAAGAFGFEWAFLGNACAHWLVIRQLASLGGLSILSALIVAVNVGLQEALLHGRDRARWLAPACALIALAGTIAWGQASFAALAAAPAPTIDVTIVQYHQSKYGPKDYNEIGLLRAYWDRLKEAAANQPTLLILPETVIKGAMGLDGTPSPTKPAAKTYPVDVWATWMTPVLAGAPTTVIVGMDTVEQGRDFNSLTVWTSDGYAGRYHKRRLVPFAEYRPWAWGGWAIRGESQYASGDTSTLRLPGLVAGPFICQEILYGWVQRTAVRDGAQLLITGANDGVFESLAVAAVHADLAQLRAVETGRWLVRVAKTGYSAIIDPAGREHERTRWRRNTVVTGRIASQTALTPYVRYGQWICWAAASVLALVLALGAAPPEFFDTRDAP